MIQEVVEHQQQASAEFFAPVSCAYLAACAAWFGWRRVGRWPDDDVPPSPRPALDFFLAIAAAAAVLGIGALYTAGYRIPDVPGTWRGVGFTLNVLLWYSPLAVVMLLRRQSPRTVWLSARALPTKLAVGVALSGLSVAVYLGMRGELARFPAVLRGLVEPHSLMHALPVFAEGVALAFLFVRLRWWLGARWALLLPCLLFALSHVGRGLADGRPLGDVLAFVVLNTVLPLCILATVARSRDVVWIGVVHYVMDVAIDAFV